MKTLVLFAHPELKYSRSNRLMLEAVHGMSGLTVVDLYAEYPRFDIDVAAEQRRLVDYDAVVFQFPLLWYSTPPLLKQWQDLVLEHGFAYGEHGTALRDKLWLCALTVGAAEHSYSEQGRHGFTLRRLLSPLQATANLCHMVFLAPYVLFGALDVDDADRRAHAAGYRELLSAILQNRLDVSAARSVDVISAAGVSALFSELTP